AERGTGDRGRLSARPLLLPELASPQDIHEHAKQAQRPEAPINTEVGERKQQERKRVGVVEIPRTKLDPPSRKEEQGAGDDKTDSDPERSAQRAKTAVSPEKEQEERCGEKHTGAHTPVNPVNARRAVEGTAVEHGGEGEEIGEQVLRH